MASEQGTLQPLDKANMQKIVNVVTQRHIKLDYDEEQLKKTLENFSGFMSQETPEKDENGKLITIPIPLQRKNIKEFKKLTNPISRAMWSVPKVLTAMSTQTYPFELGNMPSEIIISGLQEPTQQQPQKEQSTDWLGRIKNQLSGIKRDPNSPYLSMQDFRFKIQMMPDQWRLFLHWYHLTIKKRHQISTIVELQRKLDNYAIAFDFAIEPILLMSVRYANEITKQETEFLAIKVLSAYGQARERHRMEFPTLPQP